MKRLISRSLIRLLLTLCIPVSLAAQRQIAGTVTDTKGRPVVLANVYPINSFDGMATDSLGRFRFTMTGTFPMRLVASHINYHSDTLTIRKGDPTENIRIRLRETDDYKLSEVVVSVSAFGVEGKQNKTVLNPMDVYTNPSGNGDLSMALRQTPGLQDVGDREGFFVRGGASWETAVTIEGVRVKRFFGKNRFDTPARSRFETGMFSGLSLSTGGYGATEGGALSGLLQLRLAGKSPSSVAIGISPLFVNGGAGHLSKSNRFYIEQNASASDAAYIRLLLKPEYKLPGTNRSYAYNARTIWNPTPQDEVKGLFLFVHDLSSSALRIPSPATAYMLYTGRNSYGFGMVVWRHDFQGGKTTSTLSAGYSEDHNRLHRQLEIEPDMESTFRTVERDANVRLRFDSRIKTWRLSYGFDYTYSEAKSSVREEKSSVLPTLREHLVAAYAEALFPLSNRISATAGLRAEYSGLTESAIVLPRLSATYKLSSSSRITLDAGGYAAPGDYYLTHGIVPQNREHSRQYNLTYEWRPSRTQVLRLQAYEKAYSRLTTLAPDGTASNLGKGYARGLDFFWKASGLIKAFEQWFSYSYTDARRQYLFSPDQERPDFVAKHTLSTVLKYWCAPISSLFNVSMSWRSGMTYHDPNVSSPTYLNASLPANFSMSASYNYPFKYKKATGVLVFSVHNLFNSDPTYGYRFGDKPIGGVYPSVRISTPYRQFYMVGLFINFGIDRRQEIMNTDIKIKSR